MKIQTLFYKLTGIVVLCLLTACIDEEVLPGAERLFRPVVKEQTVAGTWFQMQWDRFKGALYFEVELSTDTFKTIERSIRTDSARISITNLEYDTYYQLRIRSVGDSILSTGDSIRSAFNVVNFRTLDFPTLMNTPTSTDVLDKSIRVKWKLSDLLYTRIEVLLSRDSVLKTVPVNALENQLGEKIISGLQPATTYIIKIYEGNEYKGKRNFRTLNAQVLDGNVVDLRDLTDEQAYTKITQAYIDSLGLVFPSGFNLVLSGGTTYVIPTINLPVSVNFVTGLSFRGKAIMAINGSFAIKAATTIESARFEKIFFTQGTTPGKFKTDANYGGTYLINMNQSGGSVNHVTVENCDIKYKRGAIRMQTTGDIGKLTINNCLFDSIGGFGVIHNGNDAAYIGDIVFRNSTILRASVMFVGGRARGINSFLLENVTTYWSPDLTRYFFDYNNNTVPGGFIIRHCLFGPGSGASAHGIRTASTSITVVNTFRTSDFDWTKTVDGTAYVAPIRDVEALTRPASSIFANPSAGDFRVTDTQLRHKVGDPRWW